MRNLSHRTSTIPSANSAELAPYNSKRVGLILSAPAANAYEISFTGPAALGAGIRIPAAMPPLVLWASDFGDSIQNAIQAIADTAPVTVGFTEILQVG